MILERFVTIESIVTPLDRVNVDTDQIIPKQFLKLIQRTGFGKFLFYDWRFDKEQNPKSDFVLNDPQFKDSKILVTKNNFGCGSSREHAAWAIKDYGFDVIIAPSFADIFYNNCFKNGILPIKLELSLVDELLSEKYDVKVNLEDQIIKTTSKIIPFTIDTHRKKTLLEGLDDISITLQYKNQILEYENTNSSFV